MSRTCTNCASERVAPVLDKRIEQRQRAGNKFRTNCLRCGHWNPFCSRADFLMAVSNPEKEAFVLPADADPDDKDAIVPVDEYEGEISELRDRAVRGDTPETDEAAEPDDDEEIEDVNVFLCPACTCENEGYPARCPKCGVPYEWPDEVEA